MKIQMINLKSIAVLLLIIFSSGCDFKAIKNEMNVKEQYSVMQAITSKYKDVEHDGKQYILINNALDSGTNLLLLPIVNNEKGYVVFILNPYFGEDQEVLKYLPKDKKFKITNEVILTIKNSNYIEPRLLIFLKSKVV